MVCIRMGVYLRRMVCSMSEDVGLGGVPEEGVEGVGGHGIEERLVHGTHGAPQEAGGAQAGRQEHIHISTHTESTHTVRRVSRGRVGERVKASMETDAHLD